MPKRTPVSKLPTAPASAWTKTLPTDEPGKFRAPRPTSAAPGSKARDFAKACEDADWTVTRTIKGRDTATPIRTVTAKRTTANATTLHETVTASWEAERGRPYGSFGTYTLAQNDSDGAETTTLVSKQINGAKAALGYITTPADRIVLPVAVGEQGQTVERNMPWNPDTMTNVEILLAVEGCTLTWVVEGFGVDSDDVARTIFEEIETTKDGKKTKATVQTNNRTMAVEENREGRRILKFIGLQKGSFRSVNLADLVSVV